MLCPNQKQCETDNVRGQVINKLFRRLDKTNVSKTR